MDVADPSSDEAEKGSRRTTKKGVKDLRELSGGQGVGSAILGKDSAALTITLPATQLSEDLYCYCNRISFGKVSSQATFQPSFTVSPLDDRM